MSQYVSDLSDLAKQWGNAFSQHHGTTCELTDLHATHHRMANYQKYKIGAKVANVHYKGQGVAIDLPGVVVTDTVENDTSLQQKSTFKNAKTTTSSFTWTTTEAISVGISLEFGVGVPPIASAKTTITTNISFESTQSKTETETETWEIDREVIVPPHTQMDMTWTITEKQSSVTFYADIILTGYIAIWNAHKIDINNPGGGDLHYLWFIPIDHAFRQMQHWGISVPSQYTINHGSVIYHASGECHGKSGIATSFNLKESTLITTKNSEAKRSTPRFKVITEVGIAAYED